jgi:hypothetical protein
MATIINASTSVSSLNLTGDTSGILALQADGVTKITIASSGVTATVATLNAPSGVLATQNGMTGIAKAWVNFNGTGTVAIRDSFNVSSITDNGTGDYTVNFTTAMPNANYSIIGSCGTIATNYGIFTLYNAGSVSPLTTAVRFTTVSSSFAGFDFANICVAILSS